MRNKGKEFYCRNQTKGLSIVNFDFEKAYDMVDGTFLYEVLDKLGFDKTFINQIRILYEN